jgi:hypothetical protein
LDTLSFEKVEQKVNESYYTLAKIIINGKPFIEIVKDYELPFTDKSDVVELAGSYMSAPAKYLYDMLTYNEKCQTYDDEIPILICRCGAEGCWDLIATVEDKGSVIVWKDIHNPRRSSPTPQRTSFWDYKNFPSFCFDKQQYNYAIEELGKFF